MYRVSRSREGTLYGNNYVITTHCEDNSSNTEVGNRVFANFNSSSQRLTTRSLLTHRNNDYMKFSWDPMQVVNISRQQKAVCNREIDKLRGLERYFTRQNHIETYKQSNEIDKFRAKLLRLNNLRMLNEHENKQSGVRCFPITKSSRKLRISKPATTTNYNRNTNSFDRNILTTKGPTSVDLDKRITLFNKGYTNSCGSTETNSNYSIEHLSSLKSLNTTFGKQSDSKIQIKSQPTYGQADSIHRRYQKSGKPAINKVRLSRVKCVDINSTSDLSAVTADSDVQRLDVNNSADSLPSCKNKKSVRFSEDGEFCESRRNSYDSRKFTQLVKLANNISGK